MNLKMTEKEAQEKYYFFLCSLEKDYGQIELLSRDELIKKADVLTVPIVDDDLKDIRKKLTNEYIDDALWHGMDVLVARYKLRQLRPLYDVYFESHFRYLLTTVANYYKNNIELMDKIYSEYKQLILIRAKYKIQDGLV